MIWTFVEMNWAVLYRPLAEVISARKHVLLQFASGILVVAKFPP